MIQRTEKECFKCHAVKPLVEFYRHPQMGDGHLGKCKECNKRDAINARNAKLDYYREYDKGRAGLPHRKEVHRKQSERCRERYGKDWHRSHNSLSRAIANGTVVRPSLCQKCGSACKPDGHHDDHSKPFDVLWLCKICHARRHVELKKLRAMANAYGPSPQPF